jgi:hypothetical protein
MAQFKGGKYSKKGVLSYNYLGGKDGAGGGSVSIIKKGDDWFFADKNGKVRTNLPDGGRLNSTHMQNLEKDGIFANAKIKPDGTKLSKAEIKTGPDLGSSVSGGGPTGSGIRPGGEGSSALARNKSYQLAPKGRPVTANVANPAVGANVPAPVAATGVNPNEATRIVASKSPYAQGMIGSGYSENTSYIPDTVSLPDQTMTSSPHGTEWEVPTQSPHDRNLPNYRDAAPTMPTNPNTNIYAVDDYGGISDNVQTPFVGTSEFADKGGARGMNDPGFFQKGSAGDYQQYTGGQTNFSNLDAAMAPGLDEKTLTVGEGGDPGLFQVDDDFYRKKDGTLMKDSGWFGGEDTEATQADIDAGIVDQNSSSPWGSTEGWNTAGSVMKGVGGLASAYTGIKNYQLARDAHATQQNQWQANYDQRLRAYQDNKKLANEEIRAKNRILAARGQKASYQELT